MTAGQPPPTGPNCKPGSCAKNFHPPPQPALRFPRMSPKSSAMSTRCSNSPRSESFSGVCIFCCHTFRIGVNVFVASACSYCKSGVEIPNRDRWTFSAPDCICALSSSPSFSGSSDPFPPISRSQITKLLWFGWHSCLCVRSRFISFLKDGRRLRCATISEKSAST